MKIGMNLLLWAGHVGEEYVFVLRALKATGFDGVEVPVVDTADEAHSPISPDAAARWRDFFANEEEVYTEGRRLIRDCWELAA